MRFVIPFLLSGILIIGACKQKAASNKPADTKKQEIFYPYPQYIQSQLAYLDSANFALEMTKQVNGVIVDSGFISREKLKELAKTFTEPDPNASSISGQYEETSFRDLSINTITFSISAKNADLPLQHADILLNPETNQVKYIVLKKEMNTSEGQVSSSLMWRHNMNFQVVSDTTMKDGTKKTGILKVVWDKPVSELIQ